MGSVSSVAQELSPLDNPLRQRRKKPKPPTEAEIQRRVEALERSYARKEDDSENRLRVQTELAHLRKELGKGRSRLSVTYPVNPPYAFVHLRFNEDEREFNYDVLEPSLRHGEPATVDEVRRRLETLMGQEELPPVEIGDYGGSPELRSFLQSRFEYVLDLYDIEIPSDRRRVVFYYLHRDLVGLGRSDCVLRDPFVEDVSCNGPGTPVYVFHRVLGSVRTNVVYQDAAELNRYILKLAQTSGKHVSVYQPILDATLSDGSRVNLTLGTEVTRKGSTFSIRKFTQDPISPVDLIRFGSVSPGVMAYLWHLIENKRSVLVSGGTASGKTTLLNALSMFIRPEDKVVSIEDTPEVHLAHTNWIQSVARGGYGISRADGEKAGSVSLFDLLVAALRQRPEYVLVGEVRGKEAFSLFQAISTGHAAMATIHAGSIEELLHRIENEPMNIPRVLIEALDAVVFPAQVTRDGQRLRRVRTISEVLEVDASTKNLMTNDVFHWHPEADRFDHLGRSFILEAIANRSGLDIERVEDETRRKARLLDGLANDGKSHFLQVTRAITDYYVDPEQALRTWTGTEHGT